MNARVEQATPGDATRLPTDERCVVHMIHRDVPLPPGSGPATLGAKAWNLARMAALGLPVPPGFVIGTGWCVQAQALEDGHWHPALEMLEQSCGLRLGDPRHPLLFNAQGEDVVSGRRSALGHEALAAVAPTVWQALVEATRRLERTFGDMQDFEFTVQQGQLHLLQTRKGKRTPLAAARIALDLLDEGVIEAHTAAALDLADGLLTCRGARTSHAALVARQLGKVCLVGCEALHIDEAGRSVHFGDRVLPEGAVLTLDGNEGAIYAGATAIVETVPEALLARLNALHRPPVPAAQA